jgi:hypothetical protein
MKQFTLRNAAGSERQVCSAKEMAFLAATGWRIIEVRWV